MATDQSDALAHRWVDGADVVVTVDGGCSMRCEVLNGQIEFWFGDVGSGLHLYFDRSGYTKFARVQADMVERFRKSTVGVRTSFVVGDDDIAIHGGCTDRRPD